MSKRMTKLIALAMGAMLVVGRSAIAQDPAIADEQGRRDHIVLSRMAKMMVDQALQGARRRLSTSNLNRCG
jgi:hypothetical protein